jgi:hypothetical protein
MFCFEALDFGRRKLPAATSGADDPFLVQTRERVLDGLGCFPEPAEYFVFQLTSFDRWDLVLVSGPEHLDDGVITGGNDLNFRGKFQLAIFEEVGELSAWINNCCAIFFEFTDDRFLAGGFVFLEFQAADH